MFFSYPYTVGWSPAPTGLFSHGGLDESVIFFLFQTRVSVFQQVQSCNELLQVLSLLFIGNRIFFFFVDRGEEIRFIFRYGYDTKDEAAVLAVAILSILSPTFECQYSRNTKRILKNKV